MQYLETASGALIAAHAIASIDPRQSRPGQHDFHTVHFHVGREPRTARVFAADLERFLTPTDED